ncbi:hypothetical protein KEM48_007911 [Puccinia striiformis f. sp. tritici PST-130]|nr:hypothetical protein KEM48_007911 [Puccinia striiformis f. sp. tritici PST-130]
MAPMASLLSPISPRSSSILVSHRFLIPTINLLQSINPFLSYATYLAKSSISFTSINHIQISSGSFQ